MSPDTTPQLLLFTGHSASVVSVSFSPDGNTLASAGYDGFLILWDMETGEVHRKINCETDTLTYVAYSADGRSVITSDSGWTVQVRDTETGALKQTTDAFRGEVAFSPARGIVASSTWDDAERISLWSAEEGRIVGGLATPEVETPEVIVFSPDGSKLAVVDQQNLRQVQVFDVNNGTRMWRLTPARDAGRHPREAVVENVSFSPDGRLLASASVGWTAIWSMETGRMCNCFENLPFFAFPLVAFSPDGRVLAASGPPGGRLLLRDTETWDVRRILVAHGGEIRAISFTHGGEWFATAGNDRAVRVWNARTGAYDAALRGNSYTVKSVGFSGDGACIYSEHSDLTRRTWDLSTGSLTATASPDAPRPSFGISPDGRFSLVGRDFCAELWDIRRRRLVRRFGVSGPKGYAETVTSGAFSPDCRLAALGHIGFLLTLWDIETGDMVGWKTTWRDSVGAMAFSPDGKTLAIGTSYDGVVQLFTIPGLREKRRLTGHAGRVGSAAFSPDAKTLATGGDDGTVRLWNPKNGRLLSTPLVLPAEWEHEVSLGWIIYTPEGHWQGSPRASQFVRWQVGTEILPADACSPSQADDR